ncbi:hypothetical protein PIB30_029012 [Stylosanthes scabra]|uniref:CCHC-type domain-containing protein n=1 Tax=Stylosanthes scabra TaxID=79078 RepID=A0ABU6X9B0_9FABA|nr:hypothetical protein [Stylosanthes scabra]
MQNIWRNPEGLRVVELKTKVYQIFFSKEADLERVYKGDLGISGTHGCYSKGGTGVKTRLRRDWMPILKGVNIGSKEDGLIWVEFRYEKLPNFCYYCGLIGHEESNCYCANIDAEKGECKSKEMGPWFKAEIIGSTVKIEKSNRSDEEEIRKEARAINQQKQTDKMMEKLERLTMIDKRQEDSIIEESIMLIKDKQNEEDIHKSEKEQTQQVKGTQESKQENHKDGPRRELRQIEQVQNKEGSKDENEKEKTTETKQPEPKPLQNGTNTKKELEKQGNKT